MEPDKVDLSSVNKTKKQVKLPRLKNPFAKKGAGPGRDEIGRFSSGSGGLKAVKKFNWGRALPLILVFALIGGYFVYQSFAGTYRACKINGTFTEECVTESDEAKIVRLYYGIFNRAPDEGGLNYWTNRLTRTDKYRKSLTEIARQFMGSGEFKRRYGTLNNEQFVKAMYPQVFGRDPDPSGLKFWTNRLNSKRVSRESMMVQFTESSEMKRSFFLQVAQALNLRLESFSTTIAEVPQSRVRCLGSETRAENKNLCISPDENTALRVDLAGIVKNDGAYLVSYDSRHEWPSGSGRYAWNSNLIGGNIVASQEQINEGVVVNRQFDRAYGNGELVIRPSKGETIVFMRTGTSLPGHAQYKSQVDMSSVRVRKLTAVEPRVGAEFYPDLSRRVKTYTYDNWNCPEEGLDTGESKVRCVFYYYNVIGTPSSEKPDWIHQTEKSYKGKVSFFIESHKNSPNILSGSTDYSYPAKLNVRLKNAKTGSLIEGYRVFRNDQSNNPSQGYIDNKTLVFVRDPANRPLVFPQYHNGGGGIWVEADLNSATQLRLEVDVVEHPAYYFSNSSFSVGWQSDRYIENDGYSTRED